MKVYDKKEPLTYLGFSSIFKSGKKLSHAFFLKKNIIL